MKMNFNHKEKSNLEEKKLTTRRNGKSGIKKTIFQNISRIFQSQKMEKNPIELTLENFYNNHFVDE